MTIQIRVTEQHFPVEVDESVDKILTWDHLNERYNVLSMDFG